MKLSKMLHNFGAKLGVGEQPRFTSVGTPAALGETVLAVVLIGAFHRYCSARSEMCF